MTFAHVSKYSATMAALTCDCSEGCSKKGSTSGSGGPSTASVVARGRPSSGTGNGSTNAMLRAASAAKGRGSLGKLLVSAGSEGLVLVERCLPFVEILGRPLAEVLPGHQHTGAAVRVNLGGIDPGSFHRVRDRGDEGLLVEGAGVIGLRVEEHGVLGAGVPAEPRPERLALAVEQFALRWVQANRPPTGLLPSRHLAPGAAERSAPDRPPTKIRTKHGQNGRGASRACRLTPRRTW